MTTALDQLGLALAQADPGELAEFLHTLEPNEAATVLAAVNEADVEQFIAGRKLEQVRAEVEADGPTWMRALFPQYAKAPFAPHMRILWAWVWSIDRGARPRPHVDIWARGASKSTTGEAAAISLGARGKRRYALYISGTQDQADKHVSTIGSMLESKRVAAVYPEMAERAVSQYGGSRGWSRQRLWTRQGFVIDALGLQASARGIRIEEDRPDLIILDDIDSREDGPAAVARKIDLLTSTILPAGSTDLAVMALQNVIHPNSIFARLAGLADEEADFLADRIVSGPIPAIRGLDVMVDDTGRHVVVGGEPTWEGYGLDAAQAAIDTYGYTSFLEECFPAGTLVSIVGRGVVPIEAVQPGEQVMTHAGRTRSVSSVAGRRFTGAMVRVDRAFRDGFFEVTPEHPFLVARRPRDTWRRCRAEPLLPREWVTAKDLRRGDFLLEPVPEAVAAPASPLWEFHAAPLGRPPKGNRRVEISPELMRLLGYYLAEGLTYGSYVAFTFHAREVDYVDDVKACVEKVFGPVTVTVKVSRSTEHAVDVRVSSTVAAGFFRETAGTGSHLKRVPEWAHGADGALIGELITGYWRGDGWRATAGFHVATCSADLAEDMRRLLLRVGIVAAMGNHKRVVDNGQGRGPLPRELWELRMRGAHGAAFGALVGEPAAPSIRTSAFIEDGFIHYPIFRITRVPTVNLPVFNLSVDEDESYVIEGVVAHNCQHLVKARPGGMFSALTYQRCKPEAVPPLIHRTCWVDPAVTANDGSDSQGIQIDGMDERGVIYRLWSWEAKMGPLHALTRAIRMAMHFGSPVVGVETDQGGDTWESVYREAKEAVRTGKDGREPLAGPFPAFREEKAGSSHQSKAHRASQMLTDYEVGGRIVHVEGTHEVLEAALYRFPRSKPYDLVDAAYWSWWYLHQRRGFKATVQVPTETVERAPINTRPLGGGSVGRFGGMRLPPVTRLR